jgi:hypothetical protein
MGIIEKLVTFLAVLIVIAVGACVGFFTYWPKKSGMPGVTINSAIDLNDWFKEQRDPQSNGIKKEYVDIEGINNTVRKIKTKKNGASVKQLTKKQIASKTKSSKFDNYFESSGRPIPKNEAVPKIPWVRIQEGVRYVKPKKVPRILYDKIQHFEDAFDSAKDGGGEFEETEFGSAYRINWVKPKSHLSRVAGLRKGDKILSVNGHKIGNSFTAARQLYDQLKNEKRFAVKVLRDGQPTMLSFSVN